jgi:acyl-CoA dehydrogenase
MKSWNLRKKQKAELLSQGPRIEDFYNSLQCQYRTPSDTHKDVETAVAIARKFNNDVLRPIYLERDLKHMQDHDYLSWDVVHAAAKYRLFSLFIPKLFGGGNLNYLALYPFIEEIASVCSGLGHLVFVHYLGVATLFPSLNMRVLSEVLRDVVKSESQGPPHLLDLVMTEPDAGSDAQEPLMLNRAKISSSVRKVEGGYILNGRKVFISNGRMSYWHLVQSWEDKTDRASSLMQFVIPNGTKGFCFGAKEKKMGTLASSADELLFDDCFIPDKSVSARALGPFFRDSKKGPRWAVHTMMDFVVAVSRTGVAAISVGIARGSYEIALDYARQKEIGEELLVNQQWAQIILTDMQRNVCMARLMYMESAYVNLLNSIYKFMYKKPIYYLTKYTPRSFFSLMQPILKTDLMTYMFRKYYYDWYTVEERNISSGWASLAKYSCSDIGLVNTNLALDLMGSDGLRHENGAEKFFRDIKLQQIYESTNQINQMNAFYCMIGNAYPEIQYYK